MRSHVAVIAQVLILHLLVGKTKARSVLDTLEHHPEKPGASALQPKESRMLDATSIGVPKELLGGLLAEASSFR